MRYSLAIITCLLFAVLLNAQTKQTTLLKKVTLPNGWTLSPAGRSLPLGDLPLNIAISKSKKIDGRYQ